jgi:hypothetical protein
VFHNYGDVFSFIPVGLWGNGFLLELRHECGEVLASEGPLKRGGNLFVVLLKSQETLLEFRQRREIIWCEDLALNNGEVNLDLIQPTDVHRSVEWDQGRPLVLKATDALRAAMRGAIVHDPEDPRSRAVGFLTHHLGDQPIKGGDAVFGFATAEEFGMVDVPSSDLDQSAPALVLVLDIRGATGAGRQSGVLALADLDAGLLVRADYEVALGQGGAVPKALVKIENGAGLLQELRVAGKNPAPIAPRTNSILAQPAPERDPADLRYEALPQYLLPNFGDGEARKRQAEAMREFTSQGLNLNDDAGGKSGLYAHPGAALQGRATEPDRTASAIC